MALWLARTAASAIACLTGVPANRLHRRVAVGEEEPVEERTSNRSLRDDAGMEQSITVEIAAPAERVWDVLTDVEQWPEWTETVTSVKRLDEGPLRLGSRARINQPKIPETEYVVTELDPVRSFTWVATGPGVTTAARHDVEALPGGRSRVTLAVEQGGWLGSVMGRFYRGLTDRYLANEADGLRSRCEGAR